MLAADKSGGVGNPIEFGTLFRFTVPLGIFVLINIAYGARIHLDSRSALSEKN